MRRVILFCILLQLVSLSQVWGQQNDIFTSYNTDDGLPQSSVWSITQDRHGFLWASTSDGVSRFDGYTFTTYHNNPADSASIIGGYYFLFYKDSSGALWVLSPRGVCLYNDVKDNFIRIFEYNAGNSVNEYNCIFGEDTRFIWCGLSRRGILKIDKKTHAVTTITRVGNMDISRRVTWQNGIITRGKLWAACDSIGCLVYDVATGGVALPQTRSVSCIINYNDSELLSISGSDLIVLNKQKLNSRKIPLDIPAKTIVNDISIVLPDYLLLATPDGLVYIDRKTWKTKRIIHSFVQGQKKSYTYMQCIYQDYSGNVWIGTNGDGLKKITADRKKIKFYSSFSEKSNLAKGMYADDSNLYVGYFDNGMDVFSRKNGFIKNVDTRKWSEQAQNHVYCIAPLDSSHLLLRLPTDLITYNKKTAAIGNFLVNVRDTFPRKSYSFPFLFRQKDTIYSLSSTSIFAYNVAHTADISRTIGMNVPGDMFLCAFKDERGQLWGGSINGVYCKSGGITTAIDLPEVVSVRCFNTDVSDRLWVGTDKGVYVLDSNKQVVAHYNDHNGLQNHFIYGILRDNEGDMWLSTNKGIARYLHASGAFRQYTREDGLQSNEFNTGAYFKAADGELFFGGVNGVNSFYPAEMKDNPVEPDAKITSIKLFDLPLHTDSAYWNIHSLAFAYNQNSLSFEFSAMELTNPQKNRYAYMMEGLDEKWIQVGDRRFARYAGLPPGQYTFRVKACNNDGIWQKAPTRLSITIHAPYWQQWWFRLLAALAAGGVAAAAALRIRSVRANRRRRAAELQQRIQQERERISRDLHDTVGTQLSLISNNIEWVMHPLKEISTSEKDEKLHFVNDTARDIIATLRETIWALNKQQILLEEFSDKLKNFIQKQVQVYPGIVLSFEEHIKDKVILGPSEALNLFRICQEAIANSLKYADAGQMDIHITGSEQGYCVIIQDNGKGFDISSVNAAVQNGLENMKYRAADIGSTISIVSVQGKGTRVEVTKK